MNLEKLPSASKLSDLSLKPSKMSIKKRMALIAYTIVLSCT